MSDGKEVIHTELLSPRTNEDRTRENNVNRTKWVRHYFLGVNNSVCLPSYHPTLVSWGVHIRNTTPYRLNADRSPQAALARARRLWWTRPRTTLGKRRTSQRRTRNWRGTVNARWHRKLISDRLHCRVRPRNSTNRRQRRSSKSIKMNSSPRGRTFNSSAPIKLKF